MAKKKVRPKKLKKFLPLFVMIVIAVIVAYYFIMYKGSSNTIANPASKKCLNDGGQEKIINGLSGQSGLCLFSDGSVCDEWAYYRGTCNKGECKRTCDQIGTRNEGWYDCNGKLLFYDNCTGENPNTAGTC